METEETTLVEVSKGILKPVNTARWEYWKKSCRDLLMASSWSARHNSKADLDKIIHSMAIDAMGVK